MNSSTPELKASRHRLDAALQGALSRRRPSSGSDSEDDGDGDGHKHGRRPPRKRRRKDEYDDGGSYHYTYVMKLFDRSVDLAQFGDSTPLYPIARAWMQNRPHDRRTRTAATLDIDVEKRDASLEGDSGEGRDVALEVGASGASISSTGIPDCHALPPPNESVASAPFPVVTPSQWPKESFFVHSDLGESSPFEPPPPTGPPSASDLLTGHLGRWRGVRDSWRRRSLAVEARYSRSMALLKRMFDESQASLG